MPLYELFCVAAYSAQSAPLRTLISNTSGTILANGGVVRGMQYWGRRLLPQAMKRNQVTHKEGDYFVMQVDTNPTTLDQIRARMRSDPRVLHFTPLRLGRKVHEIVPPPFPRGRAVPSAWAARRSGNPTSGALSTPAGDNCMVSVCLSLPACASPLALACAYGV